MASVTAAPTSGARKKARRGGRTWLYVVLIALAGGLGWWWWTATHPSDNSNGKLLTDTVKKGDLIESVSATGSVTPQTGAEIKIGSQITGRIKRLYADVGSQVKANDIIAELDLPDVDAQLKQAQANLDAARTRLQQQRDGVKMEQTQTAEAISEAMANVNAAKAKLDSAKAALNQQTAQTPNDILRAQAAVKVAQAALSTANSNQKQVEASANLQIATAQEQVRQAQATAKNANINLERNQTLLNKGFVAQSVVDTAQEQATVAQSQVDAAQQNVQLTKEKVAADRQSASDQVSQAKQNVDAAQAALTSARAESFTDKARQADYENAVAALRQSEAALATARGNASQDILKTEDVKQAEEAVAQAEQQVKYNAAQWDKTIIRAPISGTVLQLAAQQGETLAAGLSAPTLIIVADLNRLQVDVYVDETDIGKVKLGQEADVVVDAFPKTPFIGKVVKVASGSTIQQGVITYDVTISLEKPKRQNRPQGQGANGNGGGNGANPSAPQDAGAAPTGNSPGAPGADMANAATPPGGDASMGSPPAGAPNGQAPGGQGGQSGKRRGPDLLHQLRPDMTATATIQTGKRTAVLLVPSVAVKVGKSGSTVNVVTKKNGEQVIEPHKVRTGGNDDSNTEIRDGLNEGDVVVLAGMDSGNRQQGPQSPFGPQGNRGGGGGGGGGGGARGGGR
ncbi:MAG TPA: HlyD family efflux transporter periplasmic adaptor subunit [Chthonomonadaceae bacterium]|nr:HlyD family efflux transporter periplasmic adaptor subunit [Chthonomonadaceae bacterium]